MFRCDVCGKTTQPGEPMTKVVVETREKVYGHTETRVVRGKRIEFEVIDGKGRETVHEQATCPRCVQTSEIEG